MNIDTAIEILTDLLGEAPQLPPDDRRAAVRLGIEALLRIAELRTPSSGDPHLPLAGETFSPKRIRTTDTNKAIGILTNLANAAWDKDNEQDADAIQLGIEALKCLAQEPPKGLTCIPRPLPGETLA